MTPLKFRAVTQHVPMVKEESGRQGKYLRVVRLFGKHLLTPSGKYHLCMFQVVSKFCTAERQELHSAGEKREMRSSHCSMRSCKVCGEGNWVSEELAAGEEVPRLKWTRRTPQMARSGRDGWRCIAAPGSESE